MMLRERWDVRNVTTILGLKALTAENRILPERYSEEACGECLEMIISQSLLARLDPMVL